MLIFRGWPGRPFGHEPPLADSSICLQIVCKCPIVEDIYKKPACFSAGLACSHMMPLAESCVCLQIEFARALI